jgi:hypothetical protein
VLRIALAWMTLASTCLAQNAGGFKSYKNHEDYCFDNPKAPTCIKMVPLKPGDLTVVSPGVVRLPAARTPTSRTTSSYAGAPSPHPAVALQDWKFAHASPALLLNINVRALLQSPMWKALTASLPGAENVRTALGDVGQILISASASGGKPSTLMLVRGNVDSPLIAAMRSSGGMQSQRLDAFTVLVGEANSLPHAGLRMNAKYSPTSTGLLGTATEESMKYDFWIALDPRFLGAMAANSGAGGAKAEMQAALAVMRGLTLGIYLRDQIRFEASIEAPSAEIANRMLGAYREMEAQQKESKDNPFGNQIWASTDGAKLRFIAIADPAKFNGSSEMGSDGAKLLGPQLGPLLQALSALSSQPAAAAPVAASTEPPKQQRGTIVIQGLEGGTKEIPVK